MNPLDQLHDIVAPGEVSWWPLAWGWWVLIVLFFLAVIFLISGRVRAYRRSRPKRLVLAALQLPHGSLSAINSTIKRGLKLANAPLGITQLQGEDWIDFLIASVPAAQQQAFQEQLQPFRERLYQANTSALVDDYRAIMQHWATHTHALRQGGSDV